MPDTLLEAPVLRHEDRPRALRGGQERALFGGRGDEDRPRQDRVFAASQGRRRLFLRDFRRRRQHGGAGPGSADPFGLDAGCGARGDRRPSRGRARRRVHPQRPLSRRLAPARRQCRRPRVLRRSAAGLWLRARPLARYRQRHAGQLWRGDRNLRRGSATAAGAALSETAGPIPISRGSSSPMCAPPPSGRATCAPRSRRTGAAQRVSRRWRRNTAPTNCCRS